MIDRKNPPPMDGSRESQAYGAVSHCIAVTLQVISFNRGVISDDKLQAWENLVTQLDNMFDDPDFPNTLSWPTPPDGWNNDTNFARVWNQFTKL